MSKLTDLFSRRKQSKTAGEGPDGSSKVKNSSTGGTQPPAEKPSRLKAPSKLGAALGFLPNLKDIFAGKKQLVGLDVGSGSLKLAEILETKTGYLLNHFSEIALDKGTIEDGILVNPDALTEKVKFLFKGTGLQGKALVVSLSGHAAIAKKVTFPNMEDPELRDMIHDEASKYLPFDNMDDVNYDFQILGQNEYNPSQMDVMLVAAKRDVIADIVEAIENAKLTVLVMDVDTFCLETVYEANYDFDPTDIVAMVNIGASITNINVVKGGMSIFTRDFTLAGNTITEAVQSGRSLTFEAAEDLKINGPDADDAARNEFRNSLLSYADPICTEIERSIDYFRSTSGGDSIKKILLSGGVAAIPGITGDLTQRLGIETDILNPFRKIEWNKKVLSPERIDEIRPIAAVAVGLALRKIGDK
ncbi:MAG: type IV pilus assembly protein PilM [Candidatus Omnitrophica bacterium]|nr:type IV pilus assembly protein PilM [Candidatus Omnitrophota bacterium]